MNDDLFDHPPAAVASAHAVLTQALDWFAAGEGAALVTVQRTWSSAPRRPGSLMAVNRAGQRFGSACEGTADAAIVRAALAALAEGAPRAFGATVDDASAQAAGLPCGGVVEVRIEPLDDSPDGNVALLRELVHALALRRGVVLCTRLADARRMLIRTGEPGDTELSEKALRAAAADTTGVVEVEGEPVLLQVFNPPLRLFIVGAVHIAQALVPAARAVGFEVEVIDPRPGYAVASRFAGARCVEGEAPLALRMATLDARSAVLTLSHDASIDDPALIKALHSTAFYVGALGSRKTHKARLARLHAAGLAPTQTARLRGPAGLAIGAIGPAEIAVAIVADLIATLRGHAERAAAATPKTPA